jgi:hypothetical protein
MQFLIYVVVVLVSISSILLELDWLTKPKVEPRPAVHAASAPAPVPPVAALKADGPSVVLSPVYPKKPDAAPAEATASEAPAAPAPVETNGAAPAATAAAGTAAAPASEPDKSANKPSILPSILSAPAMTATTTPTPATATPPPATPKPVAAIPAAATPVAQQAQNSCDVAACSSAYQSFRASDCTYQPFQGPRQVCVAPPAATHKAAAQTQTRRWQADSQSGSSARQRSKDTELRDVEREVRTITTRDEADDDDDMPSGDGRVIVLQRAGPRNWRSW